MRALLAPRKAISSSRWPLPTRTRVGLGLTLPAAAVVAATAGYPLGWLFWASVLSDAPLGAHQFKYVGLDNYTSVLTDVEFGSALVQTVGFVLTTVTLELAIGFPIALALHGKHRGVRFFRTIVSLPLLMAPSVAAVLFRFLYADQYGAINGWLSLLGLQGPLWLADPWGARAAILVANLWLATPFVVLVLLAAMAGLPEELFDAGRVDGASSYQLIRYITLPLLRPAFLLILVVRVTDAARIFDLVYILTGGGPGNFTDVLSTYIYRQAFTRGQLPSAAAASVILTVVVLGASALMFRSMRRKDA